MCGIIGYTGARICKPFLLGGLERMEYRGYDSAGISLIEGDEVEVVRAVGNLSVLKQVAGTNGSPATTGIGHTRWATHGRPSEANAHPLRGLRRPLLRRAQRHRRELRGAQAAAARRGPRLQLGDRRRGGRAPARDPLRRRSRRGRAPHLPRPARAFRVLRRLAAASADDRGRAPAVPDGDRPRRGRDVPGVRRRRLPRAHARGQARRRPRARRDHARGRRSCSISTASRSSARPRPSPGIPPPPRRAATRRSCSRRSTSSPTRCARRSASGSRAARSCSTRG